MKANRRRRKRKRRLGEAARIASVALKKREREKASELSENNDNAELNERRRALVRRLARASGHLTAIKKMVEENRPFETVAPQLAAVKSALASVEKILLQEAIERRVDEAVDGLDSEALAAFRTNLEKLLKNI